MIKALRTKLALTIKANEMKKEKLEKRARAEEAMAYARAKEAEARAEEAKARAEEAKARAEEAKDKARVEEVKASNEARIRNEAKQLLAKSFEIAQLKQRLEVETQLKHEAESMFTLDFAKRTAAENQLVVEKNAKEDAERRLMNEISTRESLEKN